jgi:tetratricopeptide (TPR) repeat protein
MAKNSLRAYNREIENLIERGQTEEAIAHCKYILKQYPKHLDTYRLLGKTYLESQRYSEAADILQRVLSSIPDDFVSQLGMSIIREDEGNLDAAIWHMERAFEVQPANTAIQDELRRLYGRRDGVEPPKVRLTRGALVRMYARGELFTQAISEARAAVAEDPQRIDLEIILARMYYLAGHKVEATEVCSRLVSKLPYCLEANRILTDILPSTSRAEDAKTFQQNLNALDPYAAFISPAAPTSDQVPDQAVLLERLDWTPSADGEEPPVWTRTAGVEYKQETSDLPDWLDTLAPSALTSAPRSEPPTPPFEETIDFSSPIPKADAAEIPEWMREAGWSESSGEVKEEPASVFDLAGEDREELAEAELPSWLKDMAPPEEDEQVTAEEQARLDLLDSILPPESPVQTPSAEEEALSDALMDEETVPEDSTQTTSDVPQWLSDIDIVEDSTIYRTGRTGALPKWLEDELTSDEAEAEELPDEDLPEWLRSSNQDKTTITPETTLEPTSESEGDEEEMAGIAWLESLAENQGVDRETILTAPEDPLESPPDWVIQETEEQQDQLVPGPFDVVPDAAAPIDEQNLPLEELSSNEIPGSVEEKAVYAADLQIEELQIEDLKQSEEEILPAISEASDSTGQVSDEVYETTTAEEQSADLSDIDTMETPAPAAPSDEVEDIDAALAWLESLAVNQGADEETLSVRPEDRLESPPEWVREEMLTSAQDLDEVEPEVADERLIADEETFVEAAFEIEAAELPIDQIEIPETPAADMDEDAAFAWLESLAARQGAEEETLLTTPDNRAENPPEWVYEQTGEPADLVEPDAAEKAADSSMTEEIPSWVDEIAQGEAEETLETAAEAETETVDWFAELPAETPAAAAELELQEPPVGSLEPATEEPEAVLDWMAELETEEDLLETAEPSIEPEGELFIEEEMPQPVPDEAAEALEEGLPAIEEPAEEDITKPVAIYPPVSKSQEEETRVEPSNEPETTDFEIPSEELVLPISIKAEQPEDIGFLDEEPQETPAPTTADMLEAHAQGEEEIMSEASEYETSVSFEAESSEAAEITEPDLAEVTAPELIDETPAEIEEERLPDVSQEAVVEQLLSDDLPQTTRQQAFTLLDAGKIEAAIAQYNQVIESGELLDNVIEDLRKALDRYPVDISIWQTLGDAYLRNDQVQEALDSYTKAEELLR